MNKRERARRTRTLGIVIMVIAAVALVLPVVLDSQWTGRTTKGATPMQLTGNWLGMQLDATNSAVAQSYGIPPVVKGVVVADLLQAPGSRVLVAGLMRGDVLVGVAGTPVESLPGLFDLTTKLDVSRTLKLDVLRQGRPLQLVLPSAAGTAAPQPATQGTVQDNSATYGVPVVAR